MNKSYTENGSLAASLLGVGSNPQNRLSDGNDTTNCHACLSNKATTPEINILSDCNINEIHLNIFPPSATYIKNPSSAYQVETTPRSFLNIDIHEKSNPKFIGVTESREEKRKLSFGYFSHISLRRSDDSILNISIGNSSKITKRHKKNSWIFGRLWRFSHKRKSPTHKNTRWFFGSPLNKDDIHRLSSGSINFLNDELLISINRKFYGDIRRPSCDSKNLSNGFSLRQAELIRRNFPNESSQSNIEDGANELDCYMNEIKRRENEMFIDEKFNCM
jgi:hypothetical protein